MSVTFLVCMLVVKGCQTLVMVPCGMLQHQLHADILNECLNKFPGVGFYCVPAEYCNQLSKPNFNESVYLENLVVSLSSDIAIFWTRGKVV